MVVVSITERKDFDIGERKNKTKKHCSFHHECNVVSKSNHRKQSLASRQRLQSRRADLDISVLSAPLRQNIMPAVTTAVRTASVTTRAIQTKEQTHNLIRVSHFVLLYRKNEGWIRKGRQTNRVIESWENPPNGVAGCRSV